jgi:hypothetical protein
MDYQNIVVPTEGSAIILNKAGKLEVPNRPIIPYIEGDRYHACDETGCGCSRSESV